MKKVPLKKNTTPPPKKKRKLWVKMILHTGSRVKTSPEENIYPWIKSYQSGKCRVDHVYIKKIIIYIHISLTL